MMKIWMIECKSRGACIAKMHKMHAIVDVSGESCCFLTSLQPKQDDYERVLQLFLMLEADWPLFYDAETGGCFAIVVLVHKLRA
jgi:hypothetical protein